MSSPSNIRMRSWLLIAGMAIGSIILWIGIPAFWVLVAAQISDVGAPGMGPILLVLVATPLSMVAFAPMLTKLDQRHRELHGTLETGPKRAIWLKSMRDTHGKKQRDGVLEIVMIVSVVIAFAVIGGWLALFGKMTLPS